MSLVAPKKQLRESPVMLVLQSADDPVITAGKIQLHRTQLVFEIRADARPPSLAGIDRQLLHFCFYYTIATRPFQADSYIGIELLW